VAFAHADGRPQRDFPQKPKLESLNSGKYIGKDGSGVQGSEKEQLPQSDRRRLQSNVREDGKNHGASPRGFSEPLNAEP
jgi:hypothetical protein